ncbi:MAG: TFIIB-type zinc ribbon-containing protein [Planctomycetota bacterium]|jgi:hypothetical protein
MIGCDNAPSILAVGDRRPKIAMAEQGSSKTQQVGRIKDARGRTVTQADPIALYLLRQHNVIDADTLHAIANEKGVRIAAGERTALIGGLCGALLVVSLFTYALISGDLRDAPYAKSTGLFYLCSLPWIVWYGIKRKRVGNVAAAMLRHRRCPHCGYDIRSLPTDPKDGATVCPECGC